MRDLVAAGHYQRIIDEYFGADEVNAADLGALDFDAFLVGVRGQLNETRAAAVAAAFAKFDTAGSGCINAANLRAHFNCSAHPKVISGDLTEDEAFLEFLANFADADNSGSISAGEWNEFYAAVSSSIENDQHFCALITQSWNL